MTASILHDLDWVLPLRADWLTPVFKALTHLGYTGFFFAALPLLYWSWDKDKANRLANLTLVAALLMYFLKNCFQDPRPPVEFAMEGYRPESFGLPSGHTLLAIVFWGGLAMEIRKSWFSILTLIMITGIAFSRLYLGVHDIEDVLGGIFLGVLLLGGLHIHQVAKGRVVAPTSLFAVVLFTAALPLILWGLWRHDAPPGRFVLISSFYLGWQLGRIWEQRTLNFARLQGLKRISGALIGIVALAAMAFALKTLFTSTPVATVVAQVSGGFTIGLLITLLVPLLFVKTGIAQRSNS